MEGQFTTSSAMPKGRPSLAPHLLIPSKLGGLLRSGLVGRTS